MALEARSIMERTVAYFLAAILVVSCHASQLQADSPKAVELASFDCETNTACEEIVGCEDDGCEWCEQSWIFEAEATFLRYHRADGLRIGDDAPTENVGPNRFNAAPRATLAYITPGGLGLRSRWWSFDHQLAAVEGLPSRLDVDTYNIDLELFEQFQLNDAWDFDVSAGMRYNSFDEKQLDLVGETESRSVSFDGCGVLLGVEAKRYIYCGALFARARASLLMDDQTRVNVGTGTEVLSDVSVAQTEFALGYEFTRMLDCGSTFYLRTGGEYQSWSNYSSNYNTAVVDPEQSWVGSSDIGFAGFTVAAGLLY